MQNVAKGAGAGVLAPLWPEIGNSASNAKAYPEELLHIEAYTKGKIKPGDVLTESNVDVVKDLLDPIAYKQVKEMGRRIIIGESTNDVSTLYTHKYLDATLRNNGRAKLDGDGNLWTDGIPGKTWIGGLPFLDAKTGLEACVNISQAWGRHDYAHYPIPMWCIGPSGDIEYQYDLIWFELQVAGRNDNTVFNSQQDKLRLNTALISGPQDVAGSSFLSVWYYDQRKFPDLYGYLPAFKRVRQFPTNQRFEPLVPGLSFFLSDAWGAGDPALTWGNYKIVERKPILAAVSGKYNWTGGKDPNYMVPFHGGPKGKTFMEKTFELVPEAIVWDSEPTGYPRAPVGRRRTWSDARSGMMLTQVTYDRRGELWKQIEFNHGQWKNDKMTYVLPGEKYPDWSWIGANFHDIQDNRMTWMRHCKTCPGGWEDTRFDGGNDLAMYNKYLTNSAISRMGSA
jgi:hypothetical protein